MDDFIKLHEILGVIDDLTGGLDVGLAFEEMDTIACRAMSEIANDRSCQGLEDIRSELRDAMITRICEVLESNLTGFQIGLVVSQAEARIAGSYQRFPLDDGRFDEEYGFNGLSTLH